MSTPNLSIILVMLCFWLTLWIVNRFLIRPVTKVLDERSGRIDGAERLWTKTDEEMRAATARVEDEIAQAARDGAAERDNRRSEALAAKQERLDRARSEGEAKLAAALESLHHDADKARSDLRAKAEELGRAFASELLGREVQS